MKIFFSTIIHFVVAVLFLLSLSAAGLRAQATLTSDYPDYAPGSTATFTGTGFGAGEIVVVQVLHDDGDGSGEEHEPWDVVADANGGFVTTWHVCEDDCVGETLVAAALGTESGAYAEVTFTDAPCANFGTGVVTSVTGNNAASCSAFTPLGNDNYEVVEGGSYTMTIEGVTECGTNPITVFVQHTVSPAGEPGNFCFTANPIGGGTYVGTFTMPTPACNTYPISYKCGANAACNNSGTFNARGPSSIPSNCKAVHLRAANFGPECALIDTDTDCESPDCCTPEIICPEGLPLDCAAPQDPDNTGWATVAPGCDATISYLDEIRPGICPEKYTIVRTWTATATDECGETATCIQFIRVMDETGPTITCPADTEVDCQDSTDPADTGTATAVDDCSEMAGIDYEDTITEGNCAGNYVITRTWTATDSCDNSSTCDQIITVTDTTGPVVTCPADVEVDCQDSTDPEDTGSATAADNCSNASDPTYDDYIVDGDCAGSYTIERTWSSQDDCGNSSSCLQIITVTDTTPPTISCPDDVVANGGGECCIPVDLGEPDVEDDCSEWTVTSNAPAEFCIGDTTVTWTAMDDCGNSSTCDQLVTVLGQICATKFYDANANGVQDNGEVGIAGWLITVEPGGYSGYTDGTGSICFDVPAGSYTVSEGTPDETNWVHTTPTSCDVTIDDTTCSKSVSFGNYCFSAPANGLTLGYWSNKNGQKVLSQNWPQWKDCLNALNLKDAAGNDFQMNQPSTGNGTGVNATNAYTQFRNWILSATATNMAYMLSAQLAATTLDDKYNGLDASQNIIIPGGIKTGGNVCMVPFLSVSQAITCGAPPLLALTAVPGSTACGCSSNNGIVTIAAVMARADCLLGAYPLTKGASTQRTYQECVKNILDMINNNGNNGYACGGLSQYINSGSSTCPANF